MRDSFQRRVIYENLAWKIDLELLAADGRTITSGNGYNILDQYSLRNPRLLTKTTPWLRTEYVHFDVPPGPEVSKIRGKLYAAEYSHPPSGIKENSVLELGPITIEPVGTIQRRREETFVAVVFPLKKDTHGPKVERRQKDGAPLARIVWSKGTYDYLIVRCQQAHRVRNGCHSRRISVGSDCKQQNPNCVCPFCDERRY